MLVLILLLARHAWGENEAAPVITNTPATGIQAILREGVHPRLRWSSFPDYQAPLEQFYQARAYRPVWTRDGATILQARQVIEAISEANADGLKAEDYDAELLRGWIPRLHKGSSEQEQALFDVALSLTAMRYASNLYAGRINPRHVDFGLSIEPKRLDLPAFLNQLAGSPQPADSFAALEPKVRLYHNLKAALSRYRTLVRDDTKVTVNLPPKFKPGQSHPNVPALRQRLLLLGDLDAADASAPDPNAYDQPLVAAVKRFQARHGLGADGVIGKMTAALLDVPPAERVKQIELGLERLRWLPERLQGRYLMVNIPSFQLFGFNDGFGSLRPDVQMNVIVGEAVNGRHTPVFHSDMTYVVFRPHWNLPYKIAVKEMLPGAIRNPGYLARHNLEVVGNFGPNAPVYAPNYENLQLVSTGVLKLRQRPGPKNALGLVKFAFPNTNNIYLHSTPNKGLFARSRRDFSHGCIRVADPVGLAEWVLKPEGEWSRERIEAAMNGAKSKTVTLAQPIPVYIFYSTVLADDTGTVMFFEDIYGHDQVLEDLLAKGFPYPA